MNTFEEWSKRQHKKKSSKIISELNIEYQIPLSELRDWVGGLEGYRGLTHDDLKVTGVYISYDGYDSLEAEMVLEEKESDFRKRLADTWPKESDRFNKLEKAKKLKDEEHFAMQKEHELKLLMKLAKEHGMKVEKQ